MGQLDRPLAPRQIDQLATADEGAPEAAAQVDDGPALRGHEFPAAPRREPPHHLREQALHLHELLLGAGLEGLGS